MDQFLSRFTFGLLMAQVFPGGVFLLSLTCPIIADADPKITTTSSLLVAVGNLWFSSTKGTVLFLFLAGGLGMLIHGLSWMVMAWLENREVPAGSPVARVRDSFWHNWPLGFQVLVAPVKMIIELVWAMKAPIEKLAMEESGSYISPLDKPLYDFFQDFYLYFAQFYAHTAYALLFSVFTLGWTWAILGFNSRRLMMMVAIYFAASVSFLIGRMQFASLFKAENVLRDRAKILTVGLP
jgi:hypothetical protein